MGAWGTGIRQDDIVCDIEEAFKDQLKDGKSLRDATESVRNQYSDVLDDDDEGPLFWLALADMQWTYGDLDPAVLQRVREIVETEAGMACWGDPSDKGYKQRKQTLATFCQKVSQPNPKPSRMPKRVIRKPKFKAGDCLSILLENGQYGACLVLATDHSDLECGMDLICDLDYLSDTPPTIDVFLERRWLRLTHHNWSGELSIQWYVAVCFSKVKSRISVVGNIPILDTDPDDRSTYGNWTHIGGDIMRQHNWDTNKQA